MRMLQALAGLSVAGIGLFLFFNGNGLPGLLLLLLGGAFANGARHDVWFCFQFGDGGGDPSDSDGGGDGGGD